MPKRKGRRARPQKTSAIITRKNIGVKNKLTGTASFSIVKRGPISEAYLRKVIESAKEYNDKNGKVILDYQINIEGQDELGNPKTAVPVKKRSIYLKESFRKTFNKVKRHLNQKKASMQDFTPQIMDVILILDSNKAQSEFEDRAERSRKQRIGREKAQAKRAQLEKDIAELHALEKRRKNARLRKVGKLPPARKHKSKRK